MRQNHRIIRVDAFEGAKLSHGETVSGKPKGQPLQEGRHPQPAGGNATGVSVLTTELGPKRLGLIRELLVKPGTTGAHVIPDLKI